MLVFPRRSPWRCTGAVLLLGPCHSLRLLMPWERPHFSMHEQAFCMPAVYRTAAELARRRPRAGRSQARPGGSRRRSSVRSSSAGQMA